MKAHEQTYEEVYEDFWKSIIENPDGTLNVEQVKRELYDFKMAMDNVSECYEEITQGQLSKILTDPKYIIDIVNERIRKGD